MCLLQYARQAYLHDYKVGAWLSENGDTSTGELGATGDKARQLEGEVVGEVQQVGVGQRAAQCKHRGCRCELGTLMTR